MLSGSKNQQRVTSTALKLTAVRSSRRSLKIRRYSAPIAAEKSERLRSLGTTRLSCISSVTCRSRLGLYVLGVTPFDKQHLGGHDGEVPVPVQRWANG